MIKKISKKAIPIMMVLFLFLNTVIPVFAAIDIGDTSHLYGEKELPGLLEIKETGALKLVIKVYYRDPDTNKKLYAFCVEPDKPGVGSGASDFGGYDSYVKEKLQSDVLWRCLYFGYIGVDWRDTTVECDDDWYFVTKTVVHCLVQGKSPKEVYKIPTRIASSDVELGLTLEDTQRRGKKVLDEAEKLYNKCLSSNEKYETAKVSISKSGNTYTEGNYEVQNFKITSNKSLGSYDVNLLKFPSGTTYEKNGSTLKVKIPRASIAGDIEGLIDLANVQIETCGAFYAEATNDEFQDYIIAADPYEMTSARVPFELTTSKSIIKVEKTDEDTHEPIANVTFQLKDENGNVIQNATTNESGIATFSNLKPGKYILIEVSTNENYILDTTENKVDVGYDVTVTKEITNKHKEGNLKVYKVDKDNNEIRLGNVQFDLYSVELDKVIGTYTTNVDGEIYIENLRTGEYKLIEKNTGKWYNLAEDTEVKVEWNTDTETIIENELKKGQIKVVKVDAENNEIKLQGVEFEVLDEKGNVLEKIVTDENGEALTSRYPVRDYEKLYLKEVATNEFYKLNTEEVEITLKPNEITDITVKNEKKKGQIKVIKIDLDNNEIRIPDVEFNVYDESGEIVDTLITNENGEAISSLLPIDQEYKIKEIKTDRWYILNENIETITLKADEVTDITIGNEKKKGQIEVIKVDKDNNEIVLEGVIFDILDEQGNVVDTITTDVNGYATTKKLPIDQEYTVVEKETNKEYVLTEKTQTVILEQDKISSITFENEKIKGYVEITKTDSKSNKPLEGAIFGIYNANNEKVGTLKTDKTGKAISKLLPYGKYYLKELDTGSVYYLLNENTFEFEIVNNGEIIPVQIDNEPTDIKVDVDKEGTIEIKPGEDVNYTFSNVANNSNVYLENFKWYDYIPTDYIRLQKMTTGIWNQELVYDVYYKTNKSEEYILFKEDLSTKENYELDFAKVKLAKNEYITETCLDFGKVDTGFRESTSPTMNCKSLDTIKDGETFTNHTKTVGVYYGVTAEANSDWTTIVHIPEKPTCPTLPRTGK